MESSNDGSGTNNPDVKKKNKLGIIGASFFLIIIIAWTFLFPVNNDPYWRGSYDPPEGLKDAGIRFGEDAFVKSSFYQNRKSSCR